MTTPATPGPRFSVYQEVSAADALRAVRASVDVDDDGHASLAGWVGDLPVRWPLRLAQHMVCAWPGTLAWSESAGLALIADLGPGVAPGDGHIQTRIHTVNPARPLRLVRTPTTSPADLAQGA